MKVTQQQPPPAGVGAHATATPAGPGKLTTNNGSYQAVPGAPAELPPPPSPVRAAGARAPTLRPALVPAEPLPRPAVAPAAARHYFASDIDADQALPRQPRPARSQPAPSGTVSRVGAREQTRPGLPLTSRLSRMTGNQAFFERHGLAQPRSDLRIPALKLTLKRRDGDYKDMLTRLDSTLQDYRAALTGAHAISAQSPAERAATLAELNAQLDRLEEAIISERRTLRAEDPKHNQKKDLLRALSGVVDDERAMLVDVFNAFHAQRAEPERPVPWLHALELKRTGLNAGSNVKIGASQGKVVKSSKRLGSGAFNTVHRLKFADGSEGVFKPGVTRDSHPGAVPRYWQIPAEQPRYEARNIASANLDRQLGGPGALVDSELFVHNGQLGLLMEKAPGVSFHELGLYGGPPAAMDRLVEDPALHRDLNKLQIMDALCGQLDRHHNNMFIEVDAKGKYVRLKGIDNDHSFGANQALNDLGKFSRVTPDNYLNQPTNYLGPLLAAFVVGLPPLVDARLAEQLLAPGFAAQAQANVQGLLTPKETQRMQERVEQVQAHVRKLKAAGRTVSNWDSQRADNGDRVVDILAADPHHSYSRRFTDYMKKYEGERVVNYMMGNKGD